MNYVKHPIYRPETLAGKKVALCESGHPESGHFQVGNERDDGFHELAVVSTVVIPIDGSEKMHTARQMVIPMGQDDVNKIVKLEADSILGTMGFQFAVVRDSQSEFLLKAGHWKKSTGSQ